MTIDKHNLSQEFPEFKQRIHDLKLSDAHFRRQLEAHDTLDQRIRQIEAAGQNVADETLDELRKERLQLKDSLFAQLKKAAA